MEFVADLHLHSKYSRAVSRDMNLYNMALWGTKKGLDILSTTDWTHPLWRREIKQELVEEAEGIFKLKDNKDFKTRFILTAEISSIYSQNGKVHRIHSLVFSPKLEVCEKIAAELVKRGCNLSSDGRPIIGLSSIQLMELIFSIDKNVLLVPCHAWTPWFSLYGSNSGFDSIEECFGEYADKIYGVETGLSSDPYMNWQIKELANRSLISTSDAHSLPKMGREATVFMTKKEDTKFKITYQDITDAIKQAPDAKLKIGYTIEFYPEEGKYHFTGHRNCNFVQNPKETREDGNICPVCHRPLTVGVMHRVEELAKTQKLPDEVFKLNPNGVKWMIDPSKKHPPFVKLVPLNEIIAESLHSTVSSQKVKDMFDELCRKFGSELNVLLKVSKEDLLKETGVRVAEGVDKVRRGDIAILPGFDGQYGIVKIWGEEKPVVKAEIKTENQLGIDF
ncbi:MAG TPA: endonuclease Q family protein [Patescibacteria group bacterium]|jgi:uncharacterized protein (TIGR00375 family)|nr:endonuclease Q family protein [Patescibacteria group bacterium]